MEETKNKDPNVYICKRAYGDIGLTRPMVEQLEDDDGLVGRGLEDGASEHRSELGRVHLRDPHVASAVGKLGGVVVHAQLQLGLALARKDLILFHRH